MTAAEGEGSAPSGAGVFDRSLSWSSASGGPISSAAKEMGKRTPPKTNGFWNSFGLFRCDGKKFRGESATILPSLPLTGRAGKVGGPTDWGDYQIAHLPPAAASVGAAQRTAKCKNYAECKVFPLYGAREESFRAERGSGSGDGRTHDSLYDNMRQIRFRGVRGCRFLARAGAQEVLKPAVSSSSFGHFWGCGQK